jgi:hypothetical protein
MLIDMRSARINYGRIVSSLLALERTSVSDDDPVALNTTAIVSILVSAFADIAPQSARLLSLAQNLASADRNPCG